MIHLVYIGSPSYSGSTLLTFLLNAHPDIATIGELKWGTIDLETYRCSCGELLRECAFWEAVEARVVARGLPFDLRRPLTDFRMRGRIVSDRLVRARNRGLIAETLRDAAVGVLPAWRREKPTIAAVNRAVIESVIELQRASRFLDASKDPVRLKYISSTGDYDIRAIQLIRDGRAVVHSTVKHGKASADDAALDWAKTHRQMERLKTQKKPATWMTVRYEQLCAEPWSTLDEILRFIGVRPDLLHREYREAAHHILGNAMRLRPGGEIRADSSWRTGLSTEDLKTFDRVGGTQNREYGYL